MRHDVEINPFLGIIAILVVGVGATTLIIHTANDWSAESDQGVVTVSTSTPIAHAAQ